MKILSKCEGCKRFKLVIKKRKIRLPVGGETLSKKLLCGKCHQAIKNMLKNGIQPK